MCVFVYMQLMLGIVVSPAATQGTVAYIELKGNDDLAWGKLCESLHKVL